MEKDRVRISLVFRIWKLSHFYRKKKRDAIRSLPCLSIQINSKKEQIVKIPLSKFSKLKCSFGAWRFSSGSPNPIKITQHFDDVAWIQIRIIDSCSHLFFFIFHFFYFTQKIEENRKINHL
jgi:hypothetical protein